MNLRRKLPFFRWSFLRMLIGLPKLLREGQAGDDREEKLAKYVVANAKPGDAADGVRVIDEFAYTESFLMNVGDEKGAILDEALRRKNPKAILELGTYCGYSALRMSLAAPRAKITSVEFSAANAGIANRVFNHAGVSERVEVVVGTIGDGDNTLARLRQIRDERGADFDLVFIDHDKSHYLSDLQRLLDSGLLAPDVVIVADNIKVPGAPEYLAYMEAEEGKSFRTEHHESHVEYQTLIKDLVLVSHRLAS